MGVLLVTWYAGLLLGGGLHAMQERGVFISEHPTHFFESHERSKNCNANGGWRSMLYSVRSIHWKSGLRTDMLGSRKKDSPGQV